MVCSLLISLLLFQAEGCNTQDRFRGKGLYCSWHGRQHEPARPRRLDGCCACSRSAQRLRGTEPGDSACSVAGRKQVCSRSWRHLLQTQCPELTGARVAQACHGPHTLQGGEQEMGGGAWEDAGLAELRGRARGACVAGLPAALSECLPLRAGCRGGRRQGWKPHSFTSKVEKSNSECLPNASMCRALGTDGTRCQTPGAWVPGQTRIPHQVSGPWEAGRLGTWSPRRCDQRHAGPIQRLAAASTRAMGCGHGEVEWETGLGGKA